MRILAFEMPAQMPGRWLSVMLGTSVFSKPAISLPTYDLGYINELGFYEVQI